MKIEIDQSNKIENLNKDTIIGLSNSKVFTIRIKRQIKRKLKEEFRRKGQPQLFVFRTFIAGVVLLLRNAGIKEGSIFIDEEYSGNEKILKSMFLEMRARVSEDDLAVSFRNIGRKSNAHNISYKTMKGIIKFNSDLKFDELRFLCL